MFLVSDTQEQTMNTFYEHHQSSINFAYRCFDRILLNGLIQPFQQPERVIGFFNAYRNAERVTRNCLRDIAQQFQNWLKNRCEKWGVPILEAPEGRRDDFVDPYFTTSPHILGSWVDLDTISCIRRSIFIDFGESNGL